MALELQLLLLGCLRDVNSFVVISEHDPGTVPGDVTVALTLSSGPAQYAVQGKSEPNGVAIGQRGFVSELDIDAKARAVFRQKIMPILETKGPITLTIGSWSKSLPVSGLTNVLPRFTAICFE